MTESAGAVNSMGGSSSTSGPIQTFDPVMKFPMMKRTPKPLRSILSSTDTKKELNREKRGEM
jgi:hypothetical protein